MKTIFITIFEGVEVKNILRTPILAGLLNDKEVRIVLFTKSQQKVDHYKKEFSDPRIIFESVEWKSVSRIDRFFSKLKFVLLRTETTDLKRKMISEFENKVFGYYSGKALNFILAWSIIRRIARFCDFHLVKDSTYALFFEKYSPSAVFLAHLFDEPEIALLREAKKRNVVSIAFINSWDKVTSRCIMRLLPDKAIVFNDLVKQELIDFNEMNPKDILVSGLPQYDFFYTDQRSPREEFFKKIGVNSEKKLIVYASMGRAFSGSDWDMIDFLHLLVSSEGSLKDCDLLVRFQPNDFIDEKEITKRPHLKYDQPGVRFGTKRGVDWDMGHEDLKHLGDTLHYMSVLVCYASSISIDAAVFDKPVINIDFEIRKNDSMLKSPTQYYKTLHYKNALKTGAIDLVKSEQELIGSIKAYLDNPALRSVERTRLVSEQCAFVDGKSGKRISQFILELIK